MNFKIVNKSFKEAPCEKKIVCLHKLSQRQINNSHHKLKHRNIMNFIIIRTTRCSQRERDPNTPRDKDRHMRFSSKTVFQSRVNHVIFSFATYDERFV